MESNACVHARIMVKRRRNDAALTTTDMDEFIHSFIHS